MEVNELQWSPITQSSASPAYPWSSRQLMEDPVPNVPTMVSRLPKFGSRSALPTAVAGTAPLTNGTHYLASGTMGKGISTARQNGSVRMPASSSSSLKWKKEKGDPEEKGGSGEEGVIEAGHHPRQLQRLPAVVPEIRKPVVVKVRGSASSKTVSRAAAPKQASSGQGLCNGKAGISRQTAGGGGGGGRPRASSARHSLVSPVGTLTSSFSFSQSSGSLESGSEENMVRSQSLTHVKRIPSPSEPPIIRSYSFNRASELAKELPKPMAKSQPVKASLLARPSPVLSGGGRGSGLHLNKGVLGLAPVKAGVGTASGVLPPAALRKSLLPGPASNTTKPSALGYKLSRPSLIKQPRPVLPAPAEQVQGDGEESKGRRNSVETPPVTPDPSSTTDSPGSTPEGVTEGLLEEPATPSAVPSLGEGLEDMSLSSTSSLERNDNSEEYMDDFDNLGNGGDGILLLPAPDEGRPILADEDNTDANRRCGGASMTGLHSFLSDSVDWAAMGITGDRNHLRVLSRRASQALSGGADYAHGSSLDLSPSDSGSGGTYMWDEEGLEPLGSSTHPCGSYDSELNSMDILNNLDNLESGCDLDDDDLMLEDDLPDDGSLHSDSNGMSHLAHWRRRQLCWTAEDHLQNNDNSEVGFETYDGYPGLDTGLDSPHQAVDELTLKNMAEDCCSVKAQLEHLKLLLQMEDGSEMDNTLTLDTLSPVSREDPIQSPQVEELLREVQELKEELRSKDQIIAQLTQQMAVPVEPVRCHCQQHSPNGRTRERVTVTYHDKATQTPPWRGHAPQVLQPPRLWPTSVQQPQERLTSSVRSAAPSETPCSRPGCGWGDSRAQPSSLSSPTPPAGCVPGLLLRSQQKISDSQGPGDRLFSAKMVSSPRLSQSPGSLKKTSIPNRPQQGPTSATNIRAATAGFPRVVRGIQGRGGLSVGLVAPQSRLRQLLPPSRGLPCYSSASFQAPTLPAFPQTKAPRQIAGFRQPESGGLKASGPPSLLRLPKPKSQ
ncbi:serine-rich coiled-coil domain-containing protein 2 isoform X2 [Esox lucius]|uniref:Coiled-coil serine-rich protein 2a n=1 Tax=Esox lucius TaxID=8010 RepID=A0AAY5KKM0_ESOLU|nr:serine-rich coiled-coil domain-containing protein 2 isoform X2 [Esox lucius]